MNSIAFESNKIYSRNLSDTILTFRYDFFRSWRLTLLCVHRWNTILIRIRYCYWTQYSTYLLTCGI